MKGKAQKQRVAQVDVSRRPPIVRLGGRRRVSHRATVATALTSVAASVLVACGSGSADTDEDPPQRPSASAASEETQHVPKDTPEFDSIAALGHSGLTGIRSNPQAPQLEARQNSWATGDNPDVRSLYQRLLADHPQLEGHNYNYAVNGATIAGLETQYEDLMAHAEVAPDLIIVQFIDNDMQCDGTDEANAVRFAKTLDAGLKRMADDLPNAQFYLISQWASVQRWAAWAAHVPMHVQENTGKGPCDVFDHKGRLRAAGIRSMQHIVETYRERMERVCARHPGCYTDEGAMSTFQPTDRDVAWDYSHLSVAGHRKHAEIAWEAMPDDITQRT